MIKETPPSFLGVKEKSSLTKKVRIFQSPVQEGIYEVKGNYGDVIYRESTTIFDWLEDKSFPVKKESMFSFNWMLFDGASLSKVGFRYKILTTGFPYNKYNGMKLNYREEIKISTQPNYSEPSELISKLEELGFKGVSSE